jgi:hypothetical protein
MKFSITQKPYFYIFLYLNALLLSQFKNKNLVIILGFFEKKIRKLGNNIDEKKMLLTQFKNKNRVIVILRKKIRE